MRIEHRVGLSLSPDVGTKLKTLGIEVVESGSPLIKSVVVKISEDHPGWPFVKSLISDSGASDFLTTTFSKKEEEQAEFLKLGAWHHGYPMPRGGFGYINVTYGMEEGCRTCGAGMVQKNDFQIKGEPKWGKKHVLQLNWLFGEFFVRPEVWKEVFMPFGIPAWSVGNDATYQDLNTIVQLRIKETAPSPLLIPSDHPTETCANCGRKKYHPWTRGYFPSFANPPTTGHIWKTQEVFGSGGSAWNAVMASAALYRAIQEHKLQGVTFIPMAAFGKS